MPNITQAVSLGIIILFVVVAIPTVIDAADTNGVQTVELEENETEGLTDRLEITAEDVNASSNETTLKLRDTQSLDEDTQTIANQSTSTFNLSGGDVTVTVQEVSQNTTQADVSYPSTYGWSDGAQTLTANLGLVLVVTAFIVVVGLLRSVIQ